MAVYHGKTSNAFWGESALSNVTGWTCTLHCTTADSTARHASNTGRTREAGYKGGTATVTAKLEGDFAAKTGSASRTLELLRTATNTDLGYEGTATCTGASASVGKDDIEEVTYTFQWDGAVTTTITKGS